MKLSIVGFRFRFSGRRGDIDPGVSAAANFTWTAAPLKRASLE